MLVSDGHRMWAADDVRMAISASRRQPPPLLVPPRAGSVLLTPGVGGFAARTASFGLRWVVFVTYGF